ncbi:MAG: hypothetical protein P8177_03520 [Gemmatimonadota bacterium]
MAPFLWTGPPSRVNPFPESGDFMVEFRMLVEQFGVLDMGLNVLDWDPMELAEDRDPNEGRVMQIWARSKDGVRVMLAGEFFQVPAPTSPHQYRLVYEEGAYSLFIDEVMVAGPIASSVRPTALWMGNPTFLRYREDWSDIRVSQLTVSTPAPAAMAVHVAVKPGACPAPLNTRSRGVFPVAIAGTSDFDASQIDASTLKLEGEPLAPERHSMEDVIAPADAVGACTAANPDGEPDFTVKFRTADVVEALGEVSDGEERTLTLTGNLRTDLEDEALRGQPIEGSAVVVITKR